MQFGFTLKPDMPIARIVSLARLAARSGFEYASIFHSHVPWKDPDPALLLRAHDTERLRPAARAHGPDHRATAPRHVRDEPRDPRAIGHREHACGAADDLEGPHGPRHRARRLRAARPRQTADDARGPRGRDARHQGAL